MAEPTPAYPISEPNPPGPMLTVVAAESRPSVYDQICFRAGRTFQGVKHSAEEVFSRTKRLSARMVEERERACDEEVLRRGSAPGTYAESIL